MFPTTFISLQQKGFSLGGNWGFKSYDQKGGFSTRWRKSGEEKSQGLIELESLSPDSVLYM